MGVQPTFSGLHKFHEDFTVVSDTGIDATHPPAPDSVRHRSPPPGTRACDHPDHAVRPGDNSALFASPNGDTATRGAPSIIDVSDDRTSAFRDLLANSFPNLISNPGVVSIGDALTGEAAVRTFNVAGFLAGDTGRYYVGSNFQIDYTEAGLPDNTRWSVLYKFSPVGTTGGFLFTEGFASRPTYHADGQEVDQRANDVYTLNSNIYSLSAPGDYDYEIQALLISTEQASDGTFTGITIHDGVSLPALVHEVGAPMPEPASLAVLGVGACGLLRRKMRK